MDKILHINIEYETIKNKCYRKVVYKDTNMEIILQSLKYEEIVPFEIHTESTQFIRCEDGTGIVTLFQNNSYIEYELNKDDAITIPMGTKHQIENREKFKFKFYTIYSKPVNDVTEC